MAPLKVRFRSRTTADLPRHLLPACLRRRKIYPRRLERVVVPPEYREERFLIVRCRCSDQQPNLPTQPVSLLRHTTTLEGWLAFHYFLGVCNRCEMYYWG
jgi:hypothetical protein